MFNDFKTVPDNVRHVDLENGNRLRLTKTDPYGAIELSLEHGQLPDHLKGARFTEWSYAEIAAKKYASERQDVIAEIKKAPVKKAG